VDVAHVVAILLRKWWLLILCTAVASGVAYGVSSALPKEYSSQAKVLVGSLTEQRYDQTLAYQQLAQMYAEIATTTPVLSRVISTLGIGGDPAKLADRVTVRTATGQAIVTVVATASSPSDAERLAGAVADEITHLAQASDATTSLATVVQPAISPDGPSSPRVALNTAVAGALGLALGIGLALLLATRGSAPDPPVPQIPSVPQIPPFDAPAPPAKRR
jgi:polysaccharide biosynthesis transport protein